MKLAIIGAGSTYTPEVIDGIANNKTIPVSEIYLMDPDIRRLYILADFSLRLIKKAEAKIRIVTTEDLSEAVTDADFIISQIRVGGQAARQKDTELGLSHHLIGQETVGCGGFACALRHIPASLEIAREIEKRSPSATLINFTNPAGMVTEALCRESRIRTIGICNVYWVMVEDIAAYYKVPFEDVNLDYFGLNHLSWATKISIGGGDKTADVLKHARDIHPERYNFPPHLLEAIGALPSPYLRYYYLTPDILEELEKADKSRAQEVMEIETTLLSRYQEPGLNEKPPELMKRGGLHYGKVAVSVIKSLLGGHAQVGLAQVGHPSTHREVLNLPNKGVFPWLSPDAVIEFPWNVSANGIVPVEPPDVPAAMKALMIQVKTYERLTIEAAVTGNKKAAYQALLVNPLVNSASKAKPILDEILDI